MKKIKKIFLIIIFSICIKVNAAPACTTEEMNRLRTLANNVQFKTNYTIDEIQSGDDITDVKVSYKIDVINDNEDLKYFYSISSINKREVTSSQLSNTIFSDGDIVTIYIYSYTTNLCTDELLKSERIVFPSYNRYYYNNKDKCSKYPEFKYCREFMDISKKDYDEIEKEFDEYIKEQTNVINYVQEHLYYFVGGGVVIIVGVILLVINIKKRKKVMDI